MKIEVIEKNNNFLSFKVSSISSTQLNTIRRSILELVPVMAIEDVEIRKNTSILYDEMLAHRLGLIPLQTDLKSYNVPEKCTCKGEGCAKCQLALTLKVKGPKTAYSGNLKSKDPKVIPVFDKMPIAKLDDEQEIEVIATAQLGYGKDHAKWAPGNAWYINNPKVTINEKSKKFEEFKDKYPPQIFDKNGKIDKKAFYKPFLVDACDGVCEDIIKIDYDTDSFLFYIESWGQLSAKEILLTATSQFTSKLDEFAKALK